MSDELTLTELRLGLIQFILQLPDETIIEFDRMLSEKLESEHKVSPNWN